MRLIERTVLQYLYRILGVDITLMIGMSERFLLLRYLWAIAEKRRLSFEALQ